MTIEARDAVHVSGAQPLSILKAALASRIVAALDCQGLTVREAQAHTGQAAADFSRLRRSKLQRFTVDRLLNIAEALGERFAITVTSTEARNEPILPPPVSQFLKPLRALCRRFAVRQLAVFGSVVWNDFDTDRSDIDFAVVFVRSAQYASVDQYFAFKAALERLFGRSVDLVELAAMPESRLKRSTESDLVYVFRQAA